MPGVRGALRRLVAAVREPRARPRARRPGLSRLRGQRDLPALRRDDPARRPDRRRRGVAAALGCAAMLADLAIRGAAIRTLDAQRPLATAVAVADGTIVAVGDDFEIRSHIGATTEEIDGSGMAV